MKKIDIEESRKYTADSRTGKKGQEKIPAYCILSTDYYFNGDWAEWRFGV